MEGFDNSESHDGKGKSKGNALFYKYISSGKRTYFLDLKKTKTSGIYLEITESKRRYDEKDGTFRYDKHKIFVMNNDILSFYNELGEILRFIETNPELITAPKETNVDVEIDEQEQ